MTNEEAMNLLDNLKGMIDDSQGNDYDSAFNLAIKALEKQIPKNIDVRNSIRYHCPSCDLYFDNREWKSKYCGRCGQALKWE